MNRSEPPRYPNMGRYNGYEVRITIPIVYNPFEGTLQSYQPIYSLHQLRRTAEHDYHGMFDNRNYYAEADGPSGVFQNWNTAQFWASLQQQEHQVSVDCQLLSNSLLTSSQPEFHPEMSFYQYFAAQAAIESEFDPQPGTIRGPYMPPPAYSSIWEPSRTSSRSVSPPHDYNNDDYLIPVQNPINYQYYQDDEDSLASFDASIYATTMMDMQERDEMAEMENGTHDAVSTDNVDSIIGGARITEVEDN